VVTNEISVSVSIVRVWIMEAHDLFNTLTHSLTHTHTHAHTERERERERAETLAEAGVRDIAV